MGVETSLLFQVSLSIRAFQDEHNSMEIYRGERY